MKFYALFLSTLLSSQVHSVFALEPASAARIDEVARLGKHVMPFDLDKTLHIFSKTKTGGLQQVIAKDPRNHSQIKRIRTHLTKIAADFKQADFSDPEKIHGKNMPGLALLRQTQAGDMSIHYQTLPNGAEITYSTQKPELILAIHQWFDAQLNDHDRHATMHSQHHMMMP